MTGTADLPETFSDTNYRGIWRRPPFITHKSLPKQQLMGWKYKLNKRSKTEQNDRKTKTNSVSFYHISWVMRPWRWPKNCLDHKNDFCLPWSVKIKVVQLQNVTWKCCLPADGKFSIVAISFSFWIECQTITFMAPRSLLRKAPRGIVMSWRDIKSRTVHPTVFFK